MPETLALAATPACAVLHSLLWGLIQMVQVDGLCSGPGACGWCVPLAAPCSALAPCRSGSCCGLCIPGFSASGRGCSGLLAVYTQLNPASSGFSRLEASHCRHLLPAGALCGWAPRQCCVRCTVLLSSVALAADDAPQLRAAAGGMSMLCTGGYLVDSASSHMLVSKIKPCMSKYKHSIR